MKKLRIACVVGTRPEAIKMAPVIRALRRSRRLRPLVIATAQHREMLDLALADFGIVPDIDLNLMRPGQTQPALMGRLIARLSSRLEKSSAAAVLAQGDTATVFASALCSFLAEIPFGHVEAGLRTGDLAAPFPEEGYRSMVARVATWHFAPAATARKHLLRENIAASSIHVTGNTVLDALRWILRETAAPPRAVALNRAKRHILVTVHRRESFGRPLERIFSALRRLARTYPTIEWHYPVHPNPHVLAPARAALADLPNFHLLPPLSYREMAHLMKRSHLVVTDSGGLQEEAPFLGIPVAVVREKSERVEAVKAGTVLVAGTTTLGIVKTVSQLLDDQIFYRKTARRRNPYGDGKAAEKIVRILEKSLSSRSWDSRFPFSTYRTAL